MNDPDKVRGHVIDDKVVRIPWSGCWIWLGGLTPQGYGQVVGPWGRELVHRAFYEAFKGLLSGNLCVLHTCDVRCCVNPDHLYAGTLKDNMRDKINRNRGNHIGPALFTADQVKEIRVLLDQGVSQVDIATKFKCSQGTISNISLRRFYADA